MGRKDHYAGRQYANPPAPEPTQPDVSSAAELATDDMVHCAESTRLAQHIRLMQWCWDHGIPLDELNLPRHPVKYRAAVACLINIIKGKDLSDGEKFG